MSRFLAGAALSALLATLRGPAARVLAAHRGRQYARQTRREHRLLLRVLVSLRMEGLLPESADPEKIAAEWIGSHWLRLAEDLLGPDDWMRHSGMAEQLRKLKTPAPDYSPEGVKKRLRSMVPVPCEHCGALVQMRPSSGGDGQGPAYPAQYLKEKQGYEWHTCAGCPYPGTEVRS